MGGDRGGGGGQGPRRRKTGTSFPREATLELSGSAHACLTVEFFFLSSFFPCNKFSYYTF